MVSRCAGGMLARVRVTIGRKQVGCCFAWVAIVVVGSWCERQRWMQGRRVFVLDPSQYGDTCRRGVASVMCMCSL